MIETSLARRRLAANVLVGHRPQKRPDRDRQRDRRRARPPPLRPLYARPPVDFRQAEIDR